MVQIDNSIDFDEMLVAEEFAVSQDPKENETDPKHKPEVEPEHMPKEDPGQPDSEPDEDDDDDDPFTETEIGDDPDEIEKKTTIF
jgi:hypothetical protein